MMYRVDLNKLFLVPGGFLDNFFAHYSCEFLQESFLGKLILVFGRFTFLDSLTTVLAKRFSSRNLIFLSSGSQDENLQLIFSYARNYYHLLIANSPMKMSTPEIEELVLKRFSSGVWSTMNISFTVLFKFLDDNLFHPKQSMFDSV